MKLDEFRGSLDAAKPPKGLSAPLVALWHAARGEHDKAHAVVQDDDGRDAAWVHAHIHRAEGDEDNARYWYDRAGRAHSRAGVGEEWAEIAGALLGTHS